MVKCDRIDISEGINIETINASKVFKMCHLWCFKDIGCRYESHRCSGCHGLMQKAITFNNVAIVCVKGSAYRIDS